MKTVYKGQERRQFVRLDYTAPLAYKICKKDTVSKLLAGYTADISQSGVLCTIKDKVNKNDLLWLSFGRDALTICQEVEKRSLIYQNGIIGRVARVKPKGNRNYDIGIQFLTREEKNLTNIYPKFYFLEKQLKKTKENGAPSGLKPGVPSAAESRLPTILSGRRDKK